MKSHKRTGREAKLRRQQTAKLRQDPAVANLLTEIFTDPAPLPLVDEVDEDHAVVNGSTMYAGVDY